MEYRVEQVVVVSHRHLTLHTWESGCGNFEIGASTFGNEHGFFCRVQDPTELPFAPADLRHVLSHFRAHRFAWVRFDEAGPLMPGLRVYG